MSPFRMPALALAFAAAAGCASLASLPLSQTSLDAKAELARMKKEARPLARPVLVLSGFADPGIMPWRVGEQIREVTGDVRVAETAFFWNLSFPSCRRKAVEAVEERWPSGNPDETVEVDVVAHSMGGLVARYAALPAGTPGFPENRAPGGKRLRIHALYTIATPHQGANFAATLSAMAPDPRVRDMAPDSDFIRALNQHPPAFPLTAYGIEGDAIVGLSRSALPGQEPLWVHAEPLSPAHLGAALDPRILADVMRRLRGEDAAR